MRNCSAHERSYHTLGSDSIGMGDRLRAGVTFGITKSNTIIAGVRARMSPLPVVISSGMLVSIEVRLLQTAVPG